MARRASRRGVIDLAELRKFFGPRSADVTAKLIDAFLRPIPGRLARIKSALERGDAKALFLEAHTLKTAMAAIGAFRASRLCKRLEALAESEALPEETKTLVKELEIEGSSVADELAKLRSDGGN